MSEWKSCYPRYKQIVGEYTLRIDSYGGDDQVAVSLIRGEVETRRWKFDAGSDRWPFRIGCAVEDLLDEELDEPDDE